MKYPGSTSACLIFVLLLCVGCMQPPFEKEAVFNDLKTGDLWPGAVYADQWYAVQPIDAITFIIGEPKSSQYNNSYLMMGDRTALVFDTGSGERSDNGMGFSDFIATLNQKPLRVVLSHFHFDHTGGAGKFSAFTMIDLPYLRKQTNKGIFRISFLESISGGANLPVSDWVADTGELDLGNRTVQVLHMPGHAPESVVLIDHANKYVFTGDLAYQHLGGIVVFLPGSNLYDYVNSLQRLLDSTGKDYRFFGAHGLPEFSYAFLSELHNTLSRIQSKKAPLKLSASSLASLVPLRMYANGEMLVYLPPILNPAILYSLPALIVLIMTGILVMGVLGLAIHKIISRRRVGNGICLPNG